MREPVRQFVLIILAALGLFCAAAEESNGAIISPVAVLSNTAGDSSVGNDIGNTIDQSGLSVTFTSGVTDYATYLAGSPTHDFIAHDKEWFSPSGVTASTIIYDLGASFDLSGLALWNEEFSGILSVTVSTSDDATFTTSTSVGVLIPTNNPALLDYPAEDFRIAFTTARYVRLEVTGPQIPNGGSDTVSMGEIAFDTSTVPEPSTLILAALCLVGLAGYGWRRKR